MARVCEICGKGPQRGHNVSHAHNLTRKVWYPNLQKVRARVGGGNKRLRVFDILENSPFTENTPASCDLAVV